MVFAFSRSMRSRSKGFAFGNLGCVQRHEVGQAPAAFAHVGGARAVQPFVAPALDTLADLGAVKLPDPQRAEMLLDCIQPSHPRFFVEADRPPSSGGAVQAADPPSGAES